MSMTLRLSAAREEALAQIAEEDQVAKTDIIAIAIDQYAERRAHARKVENAMTYVLRRDAELLERLAFA